MHNRTRGKLLRRDVGAIWARYGRDMGAMWAQCERNMGAMWAQCGRNMGAIWVVGKVRTGQTLTSFAWTDY